MLILKFQKLEIENESIKGVVLVNNTSIIDFEWWPFCVASDNFYFISEVDRQHYIEVSKLYHIYSQRV